MEKQTHSIRNKKNKNKNAHLFPTAVVTSDD